MLRQREGAVISLMTPEHHERYGSLVRANNTFMASGTASV